MLHWKLFKKKMKTICVYICKTTICIWPTYSLQVTSQIKCKFLTVYERNESKKKLKMVRKTIYNQNLNYQACYVLKKTFETLKYSFIIC